MLMHCEQGALQSLDILYAMEAGCIRDVDDFDVGNVARPKKSSCGVASLR